MKQIKLFILLAFLLLNAQDSFGQTKMLLEKLTAAWCGWCPENDLEIDALVEEHGEENVIVVHHHIMDVLSTDFGTEIAQEYVNGTPALLFNRIKFEDQWNVGVTRTEWTAHMEPALAMLTDQVNIVNNSHAYNPTDRRLSFEFDLEFLVDLTGDYRLNAYIVEDVVVNSDPDYDQTNYWAGLDHPLGPYPNPIPEFEHKHVVREILGTAWGLPDGLNSTISAGETVSSSFFYEIPEHIDEDQLSYVVLVQRYDEDKFLRQILNSQMEKVTNFVDDSDPGVVSGIDDVTSKVSIFPNPVSDYLNIQSDVEINSLSVFDARGNQLYLKNDTNGIVVADLAVGWYIVQLHTDEGTIHHRFVKE